VSFTELIAKSTTGYDFDPVPIVSQFFIICRPPNFAIFHENIFQLSAFQIVKMKCSAVSSETEERSSEKLDTRWLH
jgi:hypothetical protein